MSGAGRVSAEYARGYVARRWGRDTVTQIARDLGRAVSTVSRMAHRAGLPKLRGGKPPRIPWAQIRAELAAGAHPVVVAATYETTPQVLRQGFRRRGWDIPAALRSRRGRRAGARS